MANSKVFLVGGPESLPAAARVRVVADLADKVKVPFGCGYEHFVSSGEISVVDGEELPVFSWCGATRIAE
jgi:hypothetical protein